MSEVVAPSTGYPTRPYSDKVELHEMDASNEYCDIEKRNPAMNWIPAVIAAIATLAGVVIGGWLNHYFAIRAINPTTQIRETTDAYVSFINGVASLAHSQRVDANLPDRLPQIAAAKARIAIYGHPRVIETIADFEKHGGKIAPDTFDMFLSIVLAMREHVGEKESQLQPAKNDISILLFGVPDRVD